jgi:hypothetical protein
VQWQQPMDSAVGGSSLEKVSTGWFRAERPTGGTLWRAIKTWRRWDSSQAHADPGVARRRIEGKKGVATGRWASVAQVQVGSGWVNGSGTRIPNSFIIFPINSEVE